MATPATDVFLSYKAEDRSRLVPLVEALEAEGFSVWWDTHIGGGAHWREDIQEHLDAAKCVIVVWTRRSVGPEGDFVRDEANRARRRGTYLPIQVDAVEAPLGFGEIQAISLKGWHGDRSDPHFIALADAIRECITGEHVARTAAHHDQQRISRRVLVGGGIGIGAVALAGVGGWILLKPAPANAKRIAVLPFANLSGDPAQAYFSDGIAEELRSALTRVGMEVIGRASSDAVKEFDTRTAASKLDVANILMGSVRRSPDTIRVNAQLVSGHDGVERWAQTYDRAPGDAIKIQTDIAANVAQALSITLGQAGRAALTLGGTADSVAQDLVLQARKLGRQADNAESYHRRVALAEGAIARDPQYADAYVEKANAISILARTFPATPADAANKLAEAEVAAQKAIAVAPRLGTGHTALAQIAQARFDFVNGLRHTRQALKLSPQDPEVLSSASRDLAYLASPQDALQLIDRAIGLDPLNGRLYRVKSEVLLRSLRHYQQAIQAGRKALEIAPEVHNAHIYVGDALLFLGYPDKAKAEYQALPSDTGFRMIREAIIVARKGDRAEAQRMISQIKQQLGTSYSYQYGEIYAQLGDKDRAFDELDNALQIRDSGLLYFRADPFLDPIRDDPRYAALLRKLKFP